VERVQVRSHDEGRFRPWVGLAGRRIAVFDQKPPAFATRPRELETCDPPARRKLRPSCEPLDPQHEPRRVELTRRRFFAEVPGGPVPEAQDGRLEVGSYRRQPILMVTRADPASLDQAVALQQA